MSSLKDIQDKYPIFEANQVLTNRHLNAVFDYLDKQERLTRTHLIGIGIVCGCEVTWDGSKNEIIIRKGCGVTSEGYLVKTPELLLNAQKSYLSSEPVYPSFQKENDPTALLEGIVELTADAADPKLTSTDLADKALILFIELRNEGLRNCSPNNCDDKGREMTATVKPLLVPKDFTKNLPQTPQRKDATALPDVYLPRIDVPKTGLADAQNVLKAYHSAIEEAIFGAVNKAQTTFAPLIGEAVIAPDLLKKKILTVANAPFLQNYYDFIDDLIQAYNEFRDRASDILCSCCPESNLFAQHLILGEFDATGKLFDEQNRTVFIASSALSDCDREAAEVKMLFERIAAMCQKFDINFAAKEVRITPTKQGGKLVEKAIPYYYNPDKPPALHALWNPGKTRRKREKQNLGYHSDRYAMDDFVRTPLKYDLEPYNFLRIEGHLGQNYQEVLQRLLTMKSQFRLPIDVIALRAGNFDDKVKIDFEKEKCHFEDLEAIYDAFREELKCSLGKTIANLGKIQIPPAAAPAPVGPTVGTSVKKASWISKIIPDFVPAENTIGALLHNNVSELFPEPKAGKVFTDKELLPTLDLSRLITVPAFTSPPVLASLTFIGQITKILNLLTTDLANLDWEEFLKEYNELKKIKPDNTDELKDINEQFTSVLYACRLESLKSIIEEYRRRLKEVKQKQFLSFFLQKHPGIQHKAGVPLGGTFILVYHQQPEPVKEQGGGLVLANPNIKLNDFLMKEMAVFPTIQPKITIGDRAFAIQNELLAEIRKIPGILNLDDLEAKPLPRSDENIIEQAVQKLADGTIIADFFLPYICHSDCSPVQFVLPKNKPTFTYKIKGCPDPQNQNMAPVAFKPQGGTPDYEMSINGGDYEKLSEKQLSGVNKVKIRDAEGIESIEQTIQIPTSISVEIGAFEWENVEKITYTQALTIQGGVGPYQVTFNDIQLEAQPGPLTVTGLKSGVSYQLVISDSNPDLPKGCSYEHKEPIKRGCDLPCGGLKVRSLYMLPAQIKRRANRIAVTIVEFSFEGETIVKDKSQDFASLANTLRFLQDQLNRKPESWKMGDAQMFKDSDGVPQLLGMEIERFVCQDFTLVLNMTENETVFQLIYTKEGVEVKEENRPQQRSFDYQIPAFEHTDADLCAGNNQFQRRCTDDRFEISYNFESQSAVSLPEGIVTNWYWEKSNGEKSNKPEQDLEVNSSNLLIGFTKEGCFKIQIVAGQIG